MTDIDPHISQRLLREGRDFLEHDLGALFDELGPLIAEELLSLINSTRDSTEQRKYLHMRTDVQQDWEKLAATFRDELGRQLQATSLLATEEFIEPHLSQMQLVSDDEITEQIVRREFAGRINEACSEETYAFDLRIAHLLGLEEHDAWGNQLGPSAVCAAVWAGCAAMYADQDRHTLLLRQIEPHLRAELPQLYRAVNESLIDAGILPQLKRNYRPVAAKGGRAVASDPANILGTLQRLAQARSTAVGGGNPVTNRMTDSGNTGSGSAGKAGGGSGGGEILSPDDMVAVSAALLESLQALQTVPAGPPGELTNLVRIARDSDAARQIKPLEAITLDIVAMLFDLIFDDERVPNAVKGLVSRLQIPVLKLAMLDQQFFTERSHPARRFLDSISGISIRWGKTVNEGDPFYVELLQLVERIQGTFDQNADIFGIAITELAAFVSAHEAMEAEASRVVAAIVQRKEEELLLQRERQALARQTVNLSLAPLLANPLPATIEQFLLDQWREVLQNHALRSGTDGAEYHDAERIAAELVWSVAPKKDAEERRNHAARLPKLLSGLNQGMDLVGTAMDTRCLFMDALVELHLAVLRGDKRALSPAPVPAVPKVTAPVPTLLVAHSEDHGFHLEEVSFPETAVPAENSARGSGVRRVKNLVRGDWIEFVDDDGESRRERLTWVSPSRAYFLFSNHAANCAISITAEALAHRLQTDTARIVTSDTSIFERALDGAINALDTAPQEVRAY